MNLCVKSSLIVGGLSSINLSPLIAGCSSIKSSLIAGCLSVKLSLIVGCLRVKSLKSKDLLVSGFLFIFFGF
jgi:hypothetical protein